MPTWEELIKSRTMIPSVRNSGHMLECVKIVRAKYPDAMIKQVDNGSWKLIVPGGRDLSNPHPSHYECWLEARMIQEQLG